MFGSIFVMRPRPGMEQAVIAHMGKWQEEREPKIKGFKASHLYRNVQNPAELMAAVVFDSKENYFANSDDPEQDTWYRELVALLETEPSFIDGDVLLSHTA